MTVSTKSKSKYLWLGAGIIVALLLIICNLRLILDQAAPLWDAVTQFSPWFTLVCDHARHGHLLLWDPWLDAGSPDFAEPEAGAASPIVVALGLLFTNPFHAFIAYWVGTWIFGAIGMLLLCRHLKCPAWAALVVSLGFAVNGFYTGHGEHTSMIYAYSFLPWILWRVDTAYLQLRYRGMLEAGALWGLSALGGYPQIIILTAFFVAMWLGGRLILDARSARAKRFRFTCYGLLMFGVLGVAILSPTYFAFLSESHGYSARANAITRDVATSSNLLPPSALATFSSPALYLLELPPTRLWGGESDVAMLNCYLTVLIVVFGFAALAKPSKLRLWIAAIGALFLSCAVGKYLPVRGWLYDLIPVTRFFRHPALFAGFTMFVFAVLAAFGLRDLAVAANSQESKPDRFRLILVACIAGFIAYLAHRLLKFNQGQIAHTLFVRVEFWLPWAVLITLLLLWWRRAIQARDLFWGLVMLCVFDSASTIFLSNNTLYDNGSLGWWNVMQSEHNSKLDLGAAGVDRHLHPPSNLADFYSHDRNLAIKDPELANLTALTSPIFEGFVNEPALAKLALGPQRMWFSSTPAWCSADTPTFEVFKAWSRSAPAPGMVLHTRDEMLNRFSLATTDSSAKPCNPQAGTMLPASIAVSEYTPNRLSLVYDSPAKGWLMVTDRWGRGWRSTVNGNEVPTAGADFLFRAVPVSPGRNVITMEYHVPVYYALIVLSWLTLAAICGLEVVWIRKGTRDPEQLLPSSEPAPSARPRAIRHI